MTTDITTTWVDLPLVRMRVRTVGDGSPIVLTHGLLVDGQIWDDVARHLAAGGYRVILPDLPLGAHTVPVKDRRQLTTQSVADTIVAMADALDIDRFAIVGFDTGGALAQVVTATHGERVDRLALMSCDAFTHFPPPLIRPFQWAARWPPMMTLVLASLSSPRLQHRPLPLGLVAKHKIDPRLIEAWSRPTGTDPEIRQDAVAFIKQMSSVATLAAAARLATFTGPSMVMWSREDRVFPRKDAQRLTDLLPGCQLRWIDDSYVFAPLDNPGRTTELVTEFLEL
jgi:pimeloyl-ACP methyl ester carboxylesterase